jgi:hypothetical protein
LQQQQQHVQHSRFSNLQQYFCHIAVGSSSDVIVVTTACSSGWQTGVSTLSREPPYRFKHDQQQLVIDSLSTAAGPALTACHGTQTQQSIGCVLLTLTQTSSRVLMHSHHSPCMSRKVVPRCCRPGVLGLGLATCAALSGMLRYSEAQVAQVVPMWQVSQPTSLQVVAAAAFSLLVHARAWLWLVGAK